MWSFRKKYVLIAEMLQGLVDIHNHVLPGIDDGSSNVEKSLDMLDKYHKLGYKGIVVTPHRIKGMYPNSSLIISKVFKVLSDSCEQDELSNKLIGYGAEHMLDEDFGIYLKSKELLPIVSNYVLIEMSYYQKPFNYATQIFGLQSAGYRPILAHPERYQFLEELNDYREFKKMDCKFQLNLLSLSHHYGPDVQKKAFMLLENEMIDFVATDAHSLRHLNKIERIEIPVKYQKYLQKAVDNTKLLFK